MSRPSHRSHLWAPKTERYLGNVDEILSWDEQSMDLDLLLEAAFDGTLGMRSAMTFSTTEGTVCLGKGPPGLNPDPLYLV